MMVEFRPPEYLKPGHHFNTSNLTLDLYRLLCMVVADKQVTALSRKSKIFSELSGEHLEHEVTRILVSSAVAIRVELDQHPKEVWEKWDTDCGLLFQPYSAKSKKAKSRPLKLRDACNKIIHATEIHWDIAGKYVDERYARPIVYFYGVEKKVRWRAKLMLIQFVRRSVACLRGFGYQSA